ncbi:MAG: hypothetical protein ACXWB9_10875 [Flavisolibacter sp.]
MDKNEPMKKEEQDATEKPSAENQKNSDTGFTEVKNASASGLGAMGKNADEPTSIEKPGASE